MERGRLPVMGGIGPAPGLPAGLVLGLVLVLGLASCAAPVHPAGRASSTATPGSTAAPVSVASPGDSSSGTLTAAGNRARTQAETRRLITLMPLPPGRTVLTHAPAALSGPSMGTPNDTSFIDTVKLFSVSMPFTAAVDWVQAHQPPGLSPEGSSGTGSAGTTTSTGYSYSDRDSRAWTGAGLDVSVAPDGEASDWRVDGVAQWLDPRPQPDRATGRRVHVTAATGCPTSAQGLAGVTNAGPGSGSGADLGQALLPRGRPTGALVCRYAGLNGNRFTLRSHRTIPADGANTVATAARAVPLAHVDGGVSSCPSGDASAVLIAFTYRTRTVDLWYPSDGCPFVANGTISAGGSLVPFADALRPWLS